MTISEIEIRFQKTIDQHFAEKARAVTWDKTDEMNYIGGILQAALHILPTDRYLALKQYIYDKHGYDSGGCDTGQMTLEDMIWTDN